MSSASAPCVSHRRLSQYSLTRPRIIATSSGHSSAPHMSTCRFIGFAFGSGYQIESLELQTAQAGEQVAVDFPAGEPVD